MCDPVFTPYIIGAAVASTAVQYEQGRKASSMQEDANQQATAAATKAADQADQANNRANGKQPDIAGMTSSNALAAKGGPVWHHADRAARY